MSEGRPAPRFTVLICTRNRARSLARTLDAVADIAYAHPWEVVVVDNGSTDDTEGVVSRAAAAFPGEVRYMREPRPGKSAALNRGIAESRGTIVAFTDDDALPDRNWLNELDAAFLNFGGDWAFGRVLPAWEGKQPDWFCSDFDGMFALVDLGPKAFVVRGDAAGFYGVNCAATRRALDELGRYREDLGPTSALGGGGEDTDMFQRARYQGHVVVYAPAAVVEHVIPRARMARAFHRRRMLATRAQGYRLLLNSCPDSPRLLGIPRFLYREAAVDLVSFVRAKLTADHGRAFHHELRFIRFGSVFEQGLVHTLFRRRSAEAAAVTGEQRR